MVEKQSLRNAITSEMAYILAISICLVVAILLITSQSWIEPIILLAASGVAVLINRGTNVFFGEISYITNSIAAILQLALLIDYSIVLLHTYRREKEKSPENPEKAMKTAVISVINPVSASALTTIAGLLALLFMSFKIGFDIGIVLMKGIVISAITSMTLLPAFVLLTDKAMRLAKKKAFVPKDRIFCKTAFSASKAIVPTALAVILLCGVLQTNNSYIFSDTKAANTEISDVFGNNNSVAVVYKNSENGLENEQKLADAVSGYKTASGESVLANYTAYTNTVREPYDTQKAVQKLELSESDADAKEFIDGDTVKTLKTLNVISNVMKSDLTADELYTSLTTGVMEGTDISSFSVKQLYGLRFYDSAADKSVDFRTMISFLIASSEDENIRNMFDAETAKR